MRSDHNPSFTKKKKRNKFLESKKSGGILENSIASGNFGMGQTPPQKKWLRLIFLAPQVRLLAKQTNHNSQKFQKTKQHALLKQVDVKISPVILEQILAVHLQLRHCHLTGSCGGWFHASRWITGAEAASMKSRASSNMKPTIFQSLSHSDPWSFFVKNKILEELI